FCKLLLKKNPEYDDDKILKPVLCKNLLPGQFQLEYMDMKEHISKASHRCRPDPPRCHLDFLFEFYLLSEQHLAEHPAYCNLSRYDTNTCRTFYSLAR